MRLEVEVGGDGRGVLRPPTPQDVERITEVCQDPLVQRYTRVPIPYGRDDASGFVAMQVEHWADGAGSFLLEVDGRVVASIGVVDRDEADGWAEVGYWTAPEVRRRGLTSTALRRVCRWAFDDLGVARLELQTAAGNLGSEGVARRAGFTREGVRRAAALLRAVGDMPAERVDVTVWGLLPHELDAPRDPER